MFEVLQEKREPLRQRLRQNLIDYREPLGALGVLFLIYLILPFATRLLFLSGFDGVWIRKSPSANTPDEMRIHLTRRGDWLRAEIPVSLPCNDSDEMIRLRLDGKEHPVIGGEWDCTGLPMGAAGYAATRSRDSVIVQWDLGENRPMLTETWSLSNYGSTMTWAGAGRTAVYYKASWFRSLFTSEP